jgi:hypothetical protein
VRLERLAMVNLKIAASGIWYGVFRCKWIDVSDESAASIIMGYDGETNSFL